MVAGALSPQQFTTNTTGNAGTATDRFIYNTTNGYLYFDGDGNAAGGRVLIAVLTGAPTLTLSAFDVVA